jgi:hypothetical protein
LVVHVDKLVKLLKTKAFILEKSLDTAFHRPIRFRQKVLMVFFELRWNYSPLKRKRSSCCRTAFFRFPRDRETAPTVCCDQLCRFVSPFAAVYSFREFSEASASGLGGTASIPRH